MSAEAYRSPGESFLTHAEAGPLDGGSIFAHPEVEVHRRSPCIRQAALHMEQQGDSGREQQKPWRPGRKAERTAAECTLMAD